MEANGPTMRTVLAASLLVVALVAAVLIVRIARSRRRSPLEAAIDDRLADSMGPETGSHLKHAPRVRRLAVVEKRGAEPVYAPQIRIELGTTDAPGMEMVFEYVASALEAIHPVIEDHDEHVAQYDIEFTFGPDGLLVSGECRRVTVPVELAEKLLEDDRYLAFDLRRDVERADGDAESVAALWQPCRS
ncbi:hypothetical protein QA600_22290 [Natronococcus sp. A-GB1]|uniref:hypothetical protein n=1 Tax=Natronococcus sp. A-GB1 TaxID=3037648 RepID=UPI00241C45AE|nr:hypothetical protein [Natronococcus sp. A-GB1]MDG5762049.1 hypothetical protein [Natronococcus sp. A-GB1]